MWRAALPAVEREQLMRVGFGRPLELGGTPGVVVVDVTYGFAGRRNLSAEENAARYPNWCGPGAPSACDALVSLLGAAERHEVPLVVTRGLPAVDDESPWRRKHSERPDRPADDGTLVPAVRSTAARELRKRAPSAFFGTDLASWLRKRGVTDVLVGGCSTSGCVRATVVDSFSHGFNTFVVEDATFDRSPTSHDVSLFEMHMKYATVLTLADVLAELGPKAEAATPS